MRTKKSNNKVPVQQERILKVKPYTIVNRGSLRHVAEIKLSGLWLIDLGFTPEQHVIVTAKEKEINIRLAELAF